MSDFAGPLQYLRLQPALQLALGSALRKCTGIIDLRASSQSGGEWTPSLVDLLNSGNPLVQTDADRRAAVGTSANGLPTMVFDGSDMHLWPLNAAINNGATKQGYWLAFKPAAVNITQRLLTIGIVTGGANAEKFQWYALNDQLRCEAYITNTTGRVGTTGAGTLTAGAWHGCYLGYDSSRGGDGNLVQCVNAVEKAQTFTAIGGSGSTALTVMPQPTGSAILGSFNNSDTPTQALGNGAELGPLAFSFQENLTLVEQQALLRFVFPS